MNYMEQFGTNFKGLNKFRRFPSKIPFFPENVVTGKISLLIRYDSYIGIFRPFGTISVPLKIPSFRVFHNPPSTHLAHQIRVPKVN